MRAKRKESGAGAGLAVLVSDTWKSYSQNQIGAIRPHADPRQFITTNTMGWFDGLTATPSIAIWTSPMGRLHYATRLRSGDQWCATRPESRIQTENFWVMETEPAFVNWRDTNNPLENGQVREMAWQAVGHGADAVGSLAMASSLQWAGAVPRYARGPRRITCARLPRDPTGGR